MFSRIVVGTDGSPTSLDAVRQAAELAVAGGGEVHVVTAVRDAADLALLPEMAAALPSSSFTASLDAHAAEVLARAEAVARDAGATTSTHAFRGEASDVLCRAAEDLKADLLVVGNKGMTGAARFLLGSVPNRCAHHAPCSVLIVHTS